MHKPEMFNSTFERLKSVLKEHENGLHVHADEPGHYYYLNASAPPLWKQNLFFGSVELHHDHVSYQLLPVDLFPDLLTGISKELRDRLTGRSGFQFGKINDQLLLELSSLTRDGFARLQNAGLV